MCEYEMIMGKIRIKAGDTVQIMTGADAGARGTVLKVLHDEKKVVVEGMNRVYKHVRRNQRAQQGGRLSKEMPIDVSNVMLICPETDHPTKVGVRYTDDGAKELYAKRSGATIRRISPPKESYAKK